MLPNTSQPISYTPDEHEAAVNNNYIIHTHSHTLQVGRVESGPADFYCGRLPVRQRKQTLVDELLASEELRRYRIWSCRASHKWYEETEKHQTQEEIQS